MTKGGIQGYYLPYDPNADVFSLFWVPDGASKEQIMDARRKHRHKAEADAEASQKGPKEINTRFYQEALQEDRLALAQSNREYKDLDPFEQP